MRDFLKTLLAATISSVVTAGLFAWGAQLPLYNPNSLQIPATGTDFNNLVTGINNNFVPTNGPSFNVPAGGSPSTVGGPANASTGNGVIANGILAIGANSGGWPALSVTGSDTNIGLDIVTKGTGPVMIGNPANIVPSNSITTCPGANKPQYLPMGMKGIVVNYLIVDGAFGPGTQGWVPICQ